MSIRYGVAVVVAACVFGASTVAMAGNEIGSRAGQFAGLARNAPTGHRQPRTSDVPENPELSATDLELRRLDEEIDKKLSICRGC